MDAEQEVDFVLADCFLAAGRALGRRKRVDYDAIVWWRQRYRRFFLYAMTDLGNCWEADRDRLHGVGRFLGERARVHAGDRPNVDLKAAMTASAEVEAGCRMRGLGAGHTPAGARPES
ncbi:MAG TPA: hypothetical protein VGK32_12385 [Vicinamibacterales bacterium]|jgi:hypothetical protein